MSDSITSFIGLKDSDADYCQEVIRRNDNTDHHLIYVRLVNHGGLCPQCGTFTKHIKEYRSKQINHAKFLIERARSFILPGDSAVPNADLLSLKMIPFSLSTETFLTRQWTMF